MLLAPISVWSCLLRACVTPVRSHRWGKFVRIIESWNSPIGTHNSHSGVQTHLGCCVINPVLLPEQYCCPCDPSLLRSAQHESLVADEPVQNLKVLQNPFSSKTAINSKRSTSSYEFIQFSLTLPPGFLPTRFITKPYTPRRETACK